MTYFDFSKLPNTSTLLKDFCSSEIFIDKYFPGNTIINNANQLSDIAKSFKFRKELHSAIVESMKSIVINEEQLNNIALLEQKQSLSVVSGQQVGFLGGPAYTVYKALSAVLSAEKLKQQFPELDFVPIFWVEDNDHDIAEAAKISLYNDQYDIIEFSATGNNDSYKSSIPVSECCFDSSISDTLSEIFNILPQTIFKAEVQSMLTEIYQQDKKWNDAFIQFLNHFFAEKGLLFIKASETLKTGIFKNIIQFEIANIGTSKNAVETMNLKLIEDNYHIQAKISDINLFLMQNGQRNKINFNSFDRSFRVNEKIYTEDELFNLSELHPELFSPNVLLRPIFQDYILPNCEYIAGPGEIAYFSQMSELYKTFKIQMPAIITRTGATFFDKRVLRIIESENINPFYFFRNFSEIENQLSKLIEDQNSAEQFINLKDFIHSAYSEITAQIINMDKSFNRTADSSEHNIIKELENFEKKAISVQKKFNDVLFKKYHDVSQLIYPKNKLQERVFSVVNFINNFGIEEFKEKLNLINYKKANRHFFI